MRLWIIFSALLVASCSKEEPQPSEVGAAETQAPAETKAVDSAASDAPAAQPTSPEQVAARWDDWGDPGVALVVAPGKAPLRKLRRTFEKGRTATVDLAVTAGGGGEQWTGRYMLTLETTTVSQDASKATIELLIDGATGTAAMEQLKGLRGHYTVDSLGRVADVQLKAPHGAAPATLGAIAVLERTLAMLSVPLPEDEVGQGARWTFFENVEEGSTPVAQRTTYEVTRIDGSKIYARVSVERMTKKANMDGPVWYLGFEETGAGMVSFDLAKIVPDLAKTEASRGSRFLQVQTRQVVDTEIVTTTELSAR